MLGQSFSERWTFCAMIFGHIFNVQPAVKQNVDICHMILVKFAMMLMIFGHICDEQLAVQRNVDVFVHDLFRTFVMTNRLLKEQSHEIFQVIWF